MSFVITNSSTISLQTYNSTAIIGSVDNKLTISLIIKNQDSDVIYTNYSMNINNTAPKAVSCHITTENSYPFSKVALELYNYDNTKSSAKFLNQEQSEINKLDNIYRFGCKDLNNYEFYLSEYTMETKFVYSVIPDCREYFMDCLNKKGFMTRVLCLPKVLFYEIKTTLTEVMQDEYVHLVSFIGMSISKIISSLLFLFDL